MVDWSILASDRNARSIWRKLKDSTVPIVNIDDLKNLKANLIALRKSLRDNRYFPDIAHGYLGYEKAAGCTRFVPILTKEDILIYYVLVLSLEDFLVTNRPGIYGAWRVVPKKSQKSEQLQSSKRRSECRRRFG